MSIITEYCDTDHVCMNKREAEFMANNIHNFILQIPSIMPCPAGWAQIAIVCILLLGSNRGVRRRHGLNPASSLIYGYDGHNITMSWRWCENYMDRNDWEKERCTVKLWAQGCKCHGKGVIFSRNVVILMIWRGMNISKKRMMIMTTTLPCWLTF